jgi:hypothetical protein
MNAVIALEVYQLLHKTKELAEYTPPTWRVVLCRCLGVYAWSDFIASWSLWGVLPHRAFLHWGMVCLPAEYSLRSQLFYFFFTFVCTGLPITIASFVGYKVYRSKLLDFNAQIAHISKSTADIFRTQDAYRQRAQRARCIGIYFAQIFITLVMRQFGALLTLPDTHSAAPFLVGITWFSCIPILTAAASLTKADVREAVLDLVCCRWARRRRNACSVTPHPGDVGAPAEDGQEEGELDFRKGASRVQLMEEACESDLGRRASCKQQLAGHRPLTGAVGPAGAQ